jgi:chromosomal replication initiation ATPase DnaA
MKKEFKVSEILNVVSDHYGIPSKVITDITRRTPKVAHARHVTQYITRKLTYLSLEQLGRALGSDKSSILYGFNRTSIKMHGDTAYRLEVETLIETLKAQGG